MPHELALKIDQEAMRTAVDNWALRFHAAGMLSGRTGASLALIQTLASAHWAMNEPQWNALLDTIQSFKASGGTSPISGKAYGHESRLRVAAGHAEIPITGTLIKSIRGLEWMRAECGLDVTGYDEIRDDLAAAMADASVKSITLAIDSPGGMVGGVKETADAIFAAAKQKSVVARVDDMCASAAYWLASQASKIVAGKNDSIGSIGVFMAVVDTSRAAENAGLKIHVIASGPNKGTGTRGTPLTDDQKKPLQDLIDGLAANFLADVARGRGKSVEAVKGWADGRTWLAEESRDMGLIDRVESERNTPSPNVRAAAETKDPTKGENMGDTTTAAAAPTQTADDGRRAERERTKQILAEFPKHPDFAREHIDKGSSLADAKAAFADVLKAENAQLATRLESAREAGKGAQPIEQGASSSSPQQGDFMARARQRAKDDGISMRAAMTLVAREEPALHEAFMQSMQDLRPRAAELRRKHGIG